MYHISMFHNIGPELFTTNGGFGSTWVRLASLSGNFLWVRKHRESHSGDLDCFPTFLWTTGLCNLSSKWSSSWYLHGVSKLISYMKSHFYLTTAIFFVITHKTSPHRLNAYNSLRSYVDVPIVRAHFLNFFQNEACRGVYIPCM